MAKEVIFVADDLGMSEEINDAILHSHLSGQLTAAALMMEQRGTQAAVQLARANPSLQIGWHLHLNDSTPSTTESRPWGKSPAAAGFAIGFSSHARNVMRREIKAQWRDFKFTGLECRFINSHHHLHAHPFVYQALLETVGNDFCGWIRLGEPRAFDPFSTQAAYFRLGEIFLQRRRRLSPWRSTDTLWGVDRTLRMNAGEVRTAITGLPEGFHEFIFHPRSRTCPDTQCLLQLKSSS